MPYIDSVAKARGGRTPLPSSRRHINCATRGHLMKAACRAHFNGSGVNPCLFIPLSVDINLRHFVFEYNERLSFSSTLFVVRRDHLPPKWLTKRPWSASTPITCTWRFCIINKRRTNQNSFYNLDEDYFEREAEREARFAGIEARNHWGENMAYSQHYRDDFEGFCVLYSVYCLPVRKYPSTDDADLIEDTRKRKERCLFIILSPSSLRPANFDLRDSLNTHRAVLTPILMLHRKWAVDCVCAFTSRPT